MRGQCGCCKPARRMYLRAEGRLDRAFHEADDTPAAEPPVSMESVRKRRSKQRTRGEEPSGPPPQPVV